MKQPTISVIMPVYNSEKWITRAINSILNQTYVDLELICIDDCSTDKSADIVKQIQESDKRVILIQNEKNSGPGFTRDNGIKFAKGKYIAFIDSDDFYELNAFETLLQAIERDKTNAVFANWYIHTNGVSIKNHDRAYKNELYKVDKRAGGFFISPWAKLYNRDFLIDNKIEFGNYRMNEDRFFQFKALANMEKVTLIDDYVYHWAQDNVNSITKIKSTKSYPKVLQYLDVVAVCQNYISKVKPSMFNPDADVKEIYYFMCQCPFQHFYNYCKKASLLFINTNFEKTDFETSETYNKYICFKKNKVLKLLICMLIENGYLDSMFSIKNEYSNNKKHKVITILGIKLKLKTRYKKH